MKNFLLFLGGIVTGCILTFLFMTNREENSQGIEYFETPVNYENKSKTSFEVFQVLDKDVALANEISDEKNKWYHGKTVMLINGNYYSDQIVDIESPMQVGTYSYKTKERQLLGTTIGGDWVTVPVIETK